MTVFLLNRHCVHITTSVFVKPTLWMLIYLQKNHHIFDNIIFTFNRIHTRNVKSHFSTSGKSVKTVIV